MPSPFADKRLIGVVTAGHRNVDDAAALRRNAAAREDGPG